MNAPVHIVWLASFPKSGNTWFRIFLANLAREEATPADINNLDERGAIASSRYEFEATTMLDSSLLSHDDIDNLRPRVYETIAAGTREERWIKVHDAYSRLEDGKPLFGRHVARAAVYLVRDPRDVAISFAYHNSTTIDSAIKFINSADGALCDGKKGLDPQLRQRLMDWSGHVTSWLDQSDVPVHVVRYEDLLAAPVKFFCRALQFAGRSATLDDIERAVGHADFSELRRQENARGFAERVSRTAPFFRYGRGGGWRETLTAVQVAAIEQRHGAVMARLGYRVARG
jgi:hypothetical protein